MKSNKKLICAVSLLPLIVSLEVIADQVILDDLIVSGSACVGSECEEDEVFGFDTLRLRSDTPQIRFLDTSAAQGFPTNDWTMGVADGVAGTSFFYINDADANITVMKLSSGATGGVALGANSELMDNVVSVGSAGSERRISHVADGVAPTDAVNVGQLDAQLSDLESQISEISTRIDDLLDLLDNL